MAHTAQNIHSAPVRLQTAAGPLHHLMTQQEYDALRAAVIGRPEQFSI
jgi:hypothetical protein